MWTRIRDTLKMVDVSLDGLELIRDLTQVPKHRFAEAMRSIGESIDSLREGFTGQTTPDVVREELRAIRERMFTNGGVDHKFDPSDSNHGGST